MEPTSFIETNVFVRYFTRDDEKQFQESKKLMEALIEEHFSIYTSSMVVAEIIFVLQKIYKFPKKKVLYDLMNLVLMPSVKVLDSSDTVKALSLYQEHSIKFGDAVIATQVPENVPLITYDSDFKKIPELVVLTPAEFLATLE